MTDVFRAELRQAGLDPRRTLARPDVADAALKGRIASEDFIEPRQAMVVISKAPLLRHPAPDAPRETEVLYGEPLKLLCRDGEFAFVQSEVDGYAGYVPGAAVGAREEADHRIAVPSTLLYPAPDIKTGPAEVLYLGSRFKASPCADAKFLAVGQDDFVFARHARKLDEAESDFVAVAEQFLHAPYAWGGKSVAGLDCSALVQLSLLACAVPCPRDTDMQWSELGEVVCEGAPDLPLKRGDLVFWDGHVGIMQAEDRLLHANGHHMQVRSEPLEEAIARIAALHGPVTGVKRL